MHATFIELSSFQKYRADYLNDDLTKQQRDVREKLNLSQAVFAHYLHTGETTYQNWEQGRAKPNAQAVLLIRMVQQNPETLQTLVQF